MSAKQRAPTRGPVSPVAGPAKEADQGQEDLAGNAAAQEKLRDASDDGSGDGADDGGGSGGSGGGAAGGGAPAGAPGAPPAGPPAGVPGGVPSDLPFRGEMEAAFGESFADVQVFVHDADATSMSARAYTVGEEIHFAMPRKEVDKELVAHELTHVVQQRVGKEAPSAVNPDSAVSKPGDSSETEARGVAARVASGRSAGGVSEAPSAPVQREVLPPATPATEPPAFEEETHEEQAFRVYEDDFVGPLPPKTGDAENIRRKDLPKAIDDLKLVKVARDRILAAGAIPEPMGFTVEVGKVCRETRPDILGKLYRDKKLLESPLWKANPQRLVEIARAVDPLSILQQSLQAAQTAKPTPPATIIAAWAKAYPADGVRALQSAPVQAWLAMLEEKEKTGCIELLMNGGVLSDTPLARLRRAIANKDNAAFLGAWGEIVSDAPALAKLQNDANFLTDVETALGKTTHDTVLAVLVSGGAPKTDLSHDLTPEELDAVETQARKYAKDLAEELDDVNVDEEFVLTTLKAWELAIQALFKAAETDAEKESRLAKIGKAREALKRVYADTYQRNLDEDVKKGLDGDKESPEATSLLSTDMGEKKKKDDDTAVDDTKEPPKNLTKDEKDKLLAYLTGGHLKKIHDELTSTWTKDSKVTDLLREYDEKCFAVVPNPSDAADAAGKDAAFHRRAEAKQMLREEYRGAYGTDLNADLKKAMSGDQLTYSENYAKGDKFVDPKEAEPYADKLEGDELARVKSVARQHAVDLNKEMTSVVYVSDGKVPQLLNAAKAAIRAAIKPLEETPENKKKWDAKTVQGMGVFRTEYDGSFGSLTKAIHDHVGNDGDRRTALMIIGDRADANDKLGVIDAMAGDDLGAVEELKKCAALMVPLAEAIGDEVFATFPSGGNVIKYAGQYENIKGTFKHLEDTGGFAANGGALKLLETAFLPIGGSLRMAIAGGIDKADAEIALAKLGYSGGVAAANVPRDPALEAAKAGETDKGKQEAIEKEIVAKQGMTPPVNAAFKAIEGYALATKANDDPDVSAIQAAFNQARACGKDLEPAKAQEVLEKVYAEQNGIALSVHLGLKIPAANLPKVQPITGFTGPIQSKAPKKPEDAMQVPVDEKDPALQFDPLKCQPDFSVGVAKARAIELHGFLDQKAFAKVNGHLAGDGKKEENRIVLEMFRRVYGYDLRFKLKELLGDNAAEVDRLDTLGKTAGQGTLVDQVKGKIATANITVLNTLLTNASDADRKALLNAPEVMFEIRKKFGAKAYDRIYRTLTGELTAADILRDHDEGREWWNLFGAGTDEAGAKASLKAFFGQLRAKLLQTKPKVDPNDKTAAKAQKIEVDAEMKKKALKIFAEADCQEMLNAEFSQDELLEMKQILMGAGEQTATDKVEVDVKGAGTGTAILDNLKAMTDEERKEKRNDPIFVSKLSDDLSGTQLQQALNILYADKDAEHDADLEAAINGSVVDNVDEDKIFETVTKMTPAQLQALAADPIKVAKIRTALDDNKEERQLFDKMLDDVKVMEKPGASADPNAKMTDADKKAQRQALVIKHKYSLIRACYSGRDKVLGAAQAVYKEKGEVVSDPAKPETKEELFGDTERNEIALYVEPVLIAEYTNTTLAKDETDAGFRSAVMQAIRGKADPSLYRLDQGFDLWDSKEGIDGALDGVSDETLAKGWSNIISPGENGGTLMAVYLAYKANRHDVAAKHRFIDFRLDVSADLLTTLKQSGNNKLVDFFSSTGDKDLLDFKNKVRAKINKLPGAIVAKAMNIDTSSPDGQADANLLMGIDREARSQQEQKKDDYKQQLDQGSAIDGFSDKDQALMDAYGDYMGEVGKATDSDKAGVVGTVDDEEKEAIDKKLAAFDVTMEEYKAAKGAAAEAMKWIAIAIITAVATALTGPGGPTLLAAMLSAAAQAGAAAVIDEAMLGKDYELVQTGLKKVVVDTATTALTFGASKWLEGAAAKYESVRALMDKMKAFEAWKKAIEDGGSKSLPGAFNAALLAGAGTAFGGVKDAAVSSLDPSVWKYGFQQGMTGAGKTLGGAVEKMPADVGKAMLKSLAQNGGKAAKQAIPGLADDPETPATAPGTEDATNPVVDPGKPTAGGAIKKGLGEALDPKKAASAAYDQAVDTATDKVLSGKAGKVSGWDGDMVGDFVVDFGKGQAKTAISESGSAYKKQNVAHQVAKRIQEFATVPLPPDQVAAALKHYRYYLEKKATMGDGEDLGGMTAQEWANGEWKTKIEQLNLKIAMDTGTVPVDDPKLPGLVTEYKRWALADPAAFASRIGTGFDTFVKNHESAKKTVADIKASKEYAGLPPGDKAIYDAFLADPSRLTDYTSGKASGDLDVRTPEGMTAFKTAAVATKKRMVSVFAGDTTKAWTPERKLAFETHLLENPAFALDPGDIEGTRKRVIAAAEAWDKANPVKPAAPVTPPATPPTTTPPAAP